MFGSSQTTDNTNQTLVDPFAYQSAHRRAGVLIWALSVVCIFLVFSNIALVLLAGSLFPLKEIRPAFLVIEDNDIRAAEWNIQPIMPGVEGARLMYFITLKKYVESLLTIEPLEMDARLDFAKRMSDGPVWRDFKRLRIDNDAIEDELRDGITRTITTGDPSVVEEFAERTLYYVPVVQRDYRNNNLIEERKLRVRLLVGVRPFIVQDKDKYVNPAGLFILDMGIEPLETTQEAAS